jgi:WD40 repeat protein
MPSGHTARVELNDASATATQQRDPKRYQMLGEHGRGGLGRVSRAHDIELGRDVAIKELISRSHISEVRFLREALITARLEHPGIVPVHEAGRWPDGTPFYAMKLVAGRSLRELIADCKTLDERIALLHHVIAVADAIAYAHGRNIIHRDLKPSNVIVGDFGETVVIDWGLAKDLTASEESMVGGGPFRAGHDDGLTSTGAVLGTPAYMAPEQARGEPVDQRADVYAIGAMLWELCVLEPLPPGASGQRRQLLRTSSIDGDLLAIAQKALDPDPDRRYADAGALAADLKAFKAGVRIAARRYSLWALLAHWTRRHRALALASATAVVVLAAGSALYVRNIAAERDRADASDSAAHASLSELTLRHAELLLASDPSAAIDVLASYRGDDIDRLRQIRAEATGRGVATLRASPHSDVIRWVQGTRDGAIISLSKDGTIARTTSDGRSQVMVDDVKTGGPFAYAASRHMLAYVCNPDDLCLLDITTGRRMHSRPKTSYAPLVLSFATDESQLAVLSRTGDVWTLDVGVAEEPAQRSHVHAGLAGGMLFLDRNAIALGTGDGLMMVRADGAVQKFDDPDGSLWERGVAAHQLVIATVKGQAYLLDTDDLRVSARTQLCHDPIAGLHTLRTAGVVAYACREGTVGIWDPRRGSITPKAHLDGHGGRLEATVAGDMLLAAGDKGVVTSIDLARGTVLPLRGHTAELAAIAAPTAEFPLAISGDVKGGLRAWPPPRPLARVLADIHQEKVFSSLYEPQHQVVVAVTRGPALFAYSTATGVQAAKHTVTTPLVARTANGHEFATYGSSSVIERWSLVPLERRAMVDTGHGTVSHAEFIADTSELLTSGSDGRLVRWAGAVPHEIYRFGQMIDTFARAAGASATAVASHDGTLWRVDDDGGATVLRPPGVRATQMRPLPDGISIAIGYANGAIDMLDLRSGRRTEVARASEAIGDIAVSRDGEAIALAAGDGTIRLGQRRGDSWFAAAWISLAVDARRVGFTGDGMLLSITGDGAVWLYAPERRSWAYIPTTGAALTELLLDDRGATAFVFAGDGQLISIDLTTTRHSIAN